MGVELLYVALLAAGSVAAQDTRPVAVEVEASASASTHEVVAEGEYVRGEDERPLAAIGFADPWAFGAFAGAAVTPDDGGWGVEWTAQRRWSAVSAGVALAASGMRETFGEYMLSDGSYVDGGLDGGLEVVRTSLVGTLEYRARVGSCVLELGSGFGAQLLSHPDAPSGRYVEVAPAARFLLTAALPLTRHFDVAVRTSISVGLTAIGSPAADQMYPYYVGLTAGLRWHV
jgi:hypothetical protein